MQAGACGDELAHWRPWHLCAERRCLAGVAAQDQKAFLSHTDWVAALAWHPASPHALASASYDGSVKLWDLRAAIPLHTLQGHADKALCVAWAGPERLISGGADCKLLTYTVAM